MPLDSLRYRNRHALLLIVLVGCYQAKDSEKLETQQLDDSELIDLGERLFFDQNLSSNKKVSCGTCHQPAKSFTDGMRTSTLGVSGSFIKRNTPTLINLNESPNFFFDGGSKDLESTVFSPLVHPDEMNADLILLLEYLKNDSLYSRQFELTFNTDSIVISYVLTAIASYVRSIISNQSSFDRLSKIDSLPALGFETFREKGCITCHPPPLFTDHEFHNIGLDSVPTKLVFGQSNLGRYNITQQIEDVGRFKTPTLRNLVFTEPYMHDGRFATLEEVMDHYSESTISLPNQSPALRKSRHLTDQEKEAIIEFLHLLTDSTVVEAFPISQDR